MEHARSQRDLLYCIRLWGVSHVGELTINKGRAFKFMPLATYVILQEPFLNRPQNIDKQAPD